MRENLKKKKCKIQLAGGGGVLQINERKFEEEKM